ncbi:transposase family protein [Salmonella enterica]|nr:transposase family protein [Salmonella enterica subsp. enterica serovar Montevideo]EEK7814276.1 transposase family protein [Salmonella enterica subsp. enterica serovar Montevideo]EFU4764371.1 transposase family protein [Salmonella enterica]
MYCEDNWTEIEDFAYARKDFFSQLLGLSDEIPSHDTSRRS